MPSTPTRHRKSVHHHAGGKTAQRSGEHADADKDLDARAGHGAGSDGLAFSDDVEFGRSALHDPRQSDDAASAGSLAAEPRQDGVGAVAGMDWPVLIWIVGVHLTALAAPFFFSWSGLAICLALYWVTGSFGVCMGYHRLLTHGSFTTYRPVRLFFAWLGGVSGEGSALLWVANHRKHHAFSDQDGDPHTPRDGGMWAHMLWMFPKRTTAELAAHISRWTSIATEACIFCRTRFCCGTCSLVRRCWLAVGGSVGRGWASHGLSGGSPCGW